jgi:glycosyltransferase involved in cell wall biosynthesis
MSRSNVPEISLVVPMYDEATNIDRFFAEVLPVLEQTTPSYEIVCVNDGSRDDTLSRLLAQQERHRSVVVVDLSRNFGKEAALSAGLDHSRGAAVIPIDADLQDPPALIPEFVRRWREEGADVVYARRHARQGESAVKRLSAGIFYRVLSRLADVDVPRNVGDYRLMDRAVVDALGRLPERTRFMKGMFAWVGYRHSVVEFDRDPRSGGESKWSYSKLWHFALDAITSFSSKPLKIWTYLGIAMALVSAAYGIFLILRVLVHGRDVPGYASLMVAVLLLGALQLVSIGVLGEYIARIFEEVKRRPLYLVRHLYRDGLDEEP